MTGFATLKFVGCPVTLLANSIQSVFNRGINKNEEVAELAPASFEHHGGVQNDQFRRRVCGLDQRLSDSANFGVNDLFQSSAGFQVLRFIAEHQCGHASSIDLIAVEDRVAKSLSKLLNYVRKGEDLMSDLVSIDHDRFEVVGESVRNSTLAGTDSAENAQNRRLTGNRHRLGMIW